ncbi:hypothetical protein ACROYT_G002674 [Oculina patagonica]
MRRVEMKRESSPIKPSYAWLLYNFRLSCKAFTHKLLFSPDHLPVETNQVKALENCAVYKMSHGGHSHHGGMDDNSTMSMHASTAKMNHSMMGHHGGSAHQGGHGETAGHAMMFHLRTDLNLLFEPWDISTTKVLVGSCIAVFFLSALYEGLKIFRARLMNMHTRASRQTDQEKDAVHIIGPRQGCRQNICSCHHLTQTVMHVVQVVLGYLLMLVVMTFQVYLGIAVILGAGLGYFLFAGLISENVPGEPKSGPNSTLESPAIVLKVTNFDEIRNGQQQENLEKLSFSDLAVENKGFEY